jgi:hypothetical protein
MRNPTDDELGKLDTLTVKARIAAERFELALWLLKQKCKAPSYASISKDRVWVGPDDKPLVDDACD